MKLLSLWHNKHNMKKTYFILLTFITMSLQIFSQQTSEGFTYGNEARTYLIYIPTTYDAATDTLPFVFALHGLGGTKENFNNYNGFKALAESEKFILVTPQAENPNETVTIFGQSIQASAVIQNAWHSGAGGNKYDYNGTPITLPTAYYASETRDDVGFLSALLDTVSLHYNVDSNRIYSTGFSMGAFMSNRLACELSDRIAAIASVAGTIGNEIKNTCNPDAIIPVLHIHSTDDETVAYTNNNWGMDAVDNVNFWISNNNCNTDADTTDYTNVANDNYVSQRLLYAEGDSASEVEFYHLEGPGHVWGFSDFNTASTIWEFFSKHEKVRVIEAEIEEPNAINEKQNLDFEMFPNPTNGLLNLTFSNNTTIQSIQITNTIGSVIEKEVFDYSIEKHTIDLTNKNPGLYFVQIEDNHGNKLVKRIFKK